MTKEQNFSVLKDVFIGAKVEGASGYINLMRIKSRYYEKGVFPRLQKDIDATVDLTNLDWRLIKPLIWW